MAFDPAAYIASKTQSQGFDPESYIKSKQSAMNPADRELAEKIEDENKISRFDAARIGIEKGATLGFRPAIAGAGGAIGSFIGKLREGKEPLQERLGLAADAGKSGYEEARLEAIAEEERAQAERPGYALAGEIGGSAVTLPLTALRGIKGAIGLGTIQGLGGAVSRAENLEDAGKSIVTGAATGGLAFGAGKALEKSLPAAVEATKKIAGFAGDKAKKAFSKLSSDLSGIPQKEIETYAAKTDQLNAMIKESGGNVSEITDKLRSEIAEGIQKSKRDLNKKIGTALDSVGDVRVPVDDVLDSLHGSASKLNKVLKSDQVSEIDELGTKVLDIAGPDGTVSLKELHEIKEYLQDAARSAYIKGGQIFSRGKEASQAAKNAARLARRTVNEVSPEIAQANNSLSRLHSIEEKINKNLITPEKSDAALLAVGSGGGGRNEKVLKELGDRTGMDIVGRAEEVAAAKRFASPGLLPVDVTGKSLARMTAAGAAGLIGGPGTAAILGSMTSPLALKAAINSGNVSRKAIEAITGAPLQLTEKGIESAFNAMNTPQARALMNMYMGQRVSTPKPKDQSEAIERRLKSRSK